MINLVWWQNFKFGFEVRKMKRKRSEFSTRFLVLIFILSAPKVANSNSDIWKPSAKAIYWMSKWSKTSSTTRWKIAKSSCWQLKLALWFGFETKRFEKRLYEIWWLKFFETFVRHKIHLLLNCFQALLLSAFTMFEPAHRLVFSTNEVWAKVKAYSQTCSRDIF